MSELVERVRLAIEEAGAEDMQAEHGFVPMVSDEVAKAAVFSVAFALLTPSGRVLDAGGQGCKRLTRGVVHRVLDYIVGELLAEHGLDLNEAFIRQWEREVRQAFRDFPPPPPRSPADG